MFNKWRIVLLGLVVSQGSNIVAMEKKMDSPRTSCRNPLSCSAEARNEGELIKKTAALRISAEMRKEEKKVQSRMYYPYCGYGGNTPPEYIGNGSQNNNAMLQMKPYYNDFP